MKKGITMTELTCAKCGKKFPRSATRVKAVTKYGKQKFYCSNECNSKKSTFFKVR